MQPPEVGARVLSRHVHDFAFFHPWRDRTARRSRSRIHRRVDALNGPAGRRARRRAHCDPRPIAELRQRRRGGTLSLPARARARERQRPRAAARSPRRPTHPALIHHSGTGLSRVYPRGRRLSGGAGRLHRQHHQPLHGCLDGRSRPRAARSQCARMAARVDALPRGHGRTVHTRRLDGNV